MVLGPIQKIQIISTMKIRKKYHFYAAHRNVNAGEKCGRIHGHTYQIETTFHFNTITDGITMLFSDIDKQVEPIIKQYDHFFLLHDADPLVPVLEMANEAFIKLPFETSAENLAIWLYGKIMIETGLPIVEISVRETQSSEVVYAG